MKILITCSPGLEPHESAYILVLDWTQKRIIDQIEIKHQFYNKSHKGFSGGSLSSNKLIVTSETELFEFELNPLRLVRRISHELFNDVHHVNKHDGYYYVSNSGLDSLEVFDENFRHVRSISLIRKYGFHFPHLKRLFRDDFRRWLDRRRGSYRFYDHLEKRFPLKNTIKLFDPDFFHRRNTDVRVMDFRPHVLHPNHCLSINGELWVTLWRPGAIMNVFNNKIIVNNLGRPHDGSVFDDELFVTDCSQNRIFSFQILDLERNEIEKKLERVITNKIEEGFLRGCLAYDNKLIVSLTARRSSDNWSFARLVELDRKTGHAKDEWRVPVEFGKSIYSLIDVSTIY